MKAKLEEIVRLFRTPVVLHKTAKMCFRKLGDSPDWHLRKVWIECEQSIRKESGLMRYFGCTMQSRTADAQSCAPASFCASEKFISMILGTAWLAVSIFICGMLVNTSIRLWHVVVLLSLLCFVIIILFRRKAPNKQWAMQSGPLGNIPGETWPAHESGFADLARPLVFCPWANQNLSLPTLVD